jgi:hypothetical protein
MPGHQLPEPTAPEHVEGAVGFERDSHHLQESSPGWAVTAMFYSAVHRVRAYLFAHHGERIARHDDMRDQWRKYPEMRPIKVEYELLKQESEQARYYLAEFTPAEVEALRQYLQRIQRMLEAKTARAIQR